MAKRREELVDWVMRGLDAGIEFGHGDKDGYLWILRDRDGYRFDTAGEHNPTGIHLGSAERESFRALLEEQSWDFGDVERGLCSLVFVDLMRALDQNDVAGARDRLEQARELELSLVDGAEAFVCAYEGDSAGARAALNRLSLAQAREPLRYQPHGALWAYCHLAIPSTVDGEAHRRHVAFFSTLLFAVGDDHLLSLSRALHWSWLAERSREVDDLDAAARELERALQDSPEHPLASLARINLARRLSQLGRYQEAVHHFEIYLTAQPAPAIREELEAAREALRREG